MGIICHREQSHPKVAKFANFKLMEELSLMMNEGRKRAGKVKGAMHNDVC